MTFAERPVWEIVAIIVTFCLAAAFVANLLVWIAKALGIKSYKTPMGTLSTETSLTKDSCQKFISGREATYLLLKQASVLKDIQRVENTILPDQMNLAEAEAIRIRGVAQKLFLKVLLRSLGKDSKEGLVDHRDYLEYVKCLKEVGDLAMESIKVNFRDNHYADRTESDFRAYAASHSAGIVQNMTDYLNDSYIGTLVSREATYDANRELAEAAQKDIEELYWHARGIATEASLRMKKLQEEFDTVVENMIGISLNEVSAETA